jgi:hypothetical protein
MTKKQEPIRHSASLRNRRKALHHSENFKEEAKHLFAEMVVIQEKLGRLIKLAYKVENRLKAEVRRE